MLKMLMWNTFQISKMSIACKKRRESRLRAALPSCHIVRQRHLKRQRMSVVNPVDEDFGGHFSHLLDRDVHRGEHWRDILGDVDVIHADDSDVGRNLVTGLRDGADGPDRCDIVHSEEGSDIGGAF